MPASKLGCNRNNAWAIVDALIGKVAKGNGGEGRAEFRTQDVKV